MFDSLLSFCKENKNTHFLLKILYYPAKGCQFLFSCLRKVLTFVSFIIVLPIVAIVHFIAGIAKAKHERAAMALRGHEYKDGVAIETTTLGQMLNKSKK